MKQQFSFFMYDNYKFLVRYFVLRSLIYERRKEKMSFEEIYRIKQFRPYSTNIFPNTY